MGCDRNESGFGCGGKAAAGIVVNGDWSMTVNATVTSTCQWIVSTVPNHQVRRSVSSPECERIPRPIVLQKTPGTSVRLRGLGVVVSVAIAAAAIFALTHTLRNVDY